MTADQRRKTETQSLRILVADDTEASLALLRVALTMEGHVVIVATSGEEALACFTADRPDIVLMDVMMPGIGGIEATRRMRALQAKHWVPIIFISALSHRDDMVRGFDAGGDDYLLKPVDLVLLMAKVNAMGRTLEIASSLHAANEALSRYRNFSEDDLDMAKELMAHMVHESSHPVSGVDLWLQPANNMSGDLVITQKYWDDRYYVLLADARGHGLPAALSLMPLVQVFSAMTRQGFTVSAIIREMNRHLMSMLPVGNFVAVTLLSIDRMNRMLEVWNGGNPHVLLLDTDGNPVHEFKSNHPAVAILRGEDFDASTECYRWDKEGWLACYSDGLSEAENADGVEFGVAQVVAALKGENPYGSLKQAVDMHLDGRHPHDDISLAIINLQQSDVQLQYGSIQLQDCNSQQTYRPPVSSRFFSTRHSTAANSSKAAPPSHSGHRTG